MSKKWENDDKLDTTMKKYVKEGLTRMEILAFLRRDFPNYCWSIATLDRRLRYFDIYYIDSLVNEEHIVEAVLDELEGPGQLLGYRALHKKLRQVHDLKVPRSIVYSIIRAADPEGMVARAPSFKNKKKRGHFLSPGPNFVHSLDGHDKLMGYQTSTFPIAIYGCMDTCSRKILWIKVWRGNSNPRLIGRFYLEHLHESKKMAKYLRLDKPTDTNVMAAMHAFLRQHHQDMEASDTVIYGPSTSNQIECWWRELHERLEKFFKVELNFLLKRKFYDPTNELHRSALAYIMIPLMQKNIDEFVDVVWNSHRTREQKDTKLPCGVPNHMFSFPEKYGLKEFGLPVDLHQLEEVAMVSGILDCGQDYLASDLRIAFERALPKPEEIDPAKCGEEFIGLLRAVNLSAI